MNSSVSTNDLLNYLSHLKSIKKSLGNYFFHKEDDLYIIFGGIDNLPKLTLSQEIFKIFQELEV